MVARLRLADEAAAQLREERSDHGDNSGTPDGVEVALIETWTAKTPGDERKDEHTRWERSPRRMGPTPRLGESTVHRGLISREQLEEALERQRSTGQRLGETLLEVGAVSAVQFGQALADQLGVPFVDLETSPPDVMVAALITEASRGRYRGGAGGAVERPAGGRDGGTEERVCAR